MTHSYKRTLAVLTIALLAIFTLRAGNKLPSSLTMSRETLMDKIKGAWAGQVLGCTYGGPTEFGFRSMMIPESTKIPWGDPDYVAKTMKNIHTLYDDIYMDLTFVGVFERLGLDAPTDSLASAFANAGYYLWHANQAARYNILHGIRPPMSGHWRNNPHADDIDYQIEADYASIMSPGMPNAASKISDRVGHIMNYGDGWYGGVYIGAMYSMAFICDDMETIVTEALKTIPKKSKFHRCMADVIDIWRNNPNDWRRGWQLCEERWGTSDAGCSEGTLAPLNIDAAINCAYVLFGLLYGNGDFTQTIDISTRCGQDSDCNPASAAGILATAIGYSKIPSEWLEPLKNAENIDFAYTPYSLNDTYQMSFSHALQMIERGGGKVNDNEVTIKCQSPKPVRYEKSFPNITPDKRMPIKIELSESGHTINADCAGIVINGGVSAKDKQYNAEIEVTLDGGKPQKVDMPASFRKRRLDIYWNFEMKQKPHRITLRWLNPKEGVKVVVTDAILFNKK
jgi:hypothetical protein